MAKYVVVTVPLKILFDYPTDIYTPSKEMNSFWSGGIVNLEKEIEAYDILSEWTEENSNENTWFPTIFINSNVIWFMLCVLLCCAIVHGLDDLWGTGYPKLEISHRPLTNHDPINQSHVTWQWVRVWPHQTWVITTLTYTTSHRTVQKHLEQYGIVQKVPQSAEECYGMQWNGMEYSGI
jgi:hypothetical protein